MSATIVQPLDLQEQVARIERAQEETRQFVAEQHKLIAESSKLISASANLERDRRLAPIVFAATTLGAIIAAGVAVAVRLIH